MNLKLKLILCYLLACLCISNPLVTLSSHSNSIPCLSYSPDYKYLASGSIDQTINIYSTEPYELIATLIGHTHFVSSLSFSADGKYLASASLDKTVRIWTLNDWKLFKVLKGHNKQVHSVEFINSTN